MQKRKVDPWGIENFKDSTRNLRGLKDLKGLWDKSRAPKYLRGLEDLKGLRDGLFYRVGGFFIRSC
jgi:hypothetical protein